MTTSHEDVMLIYKWFCSAMRKVGRKESFPKGTDPTKTYKYRALVDFAENVEKWGFDNATVKSVIESVVVYAKQKKILSKGTTILCMKSVLEICIESLERKAENTEGVISAIERCHTYLVRNGFTIVHDLVTAERSGGMSRLSALLTSGKMPTAYLAVSRIAGHALSKIQERDQYPSDRELRRLRAKLLYDADSRVKLEAALGSDLNTSGLVGSVTCRT